VICWGNDYDREDRRFLDTLIELEPSVLGRAVPDAGSEPLERRLSALRGRAQQARPERYVTRVVGDGSAA
jgi:hypothetical protein